MFKLDIKHRASYILVVIAFYLFRCYRKPYVNEIYFALHDRASSLKRIRRYESKMIYKILLTSGRYED
jgi:hypothetical protein